MGTPPLARRCDVRTKYASLLASRAALHLDIFEQPGQERVFQRPAKVMLTFFLLIGIPSCGALLALGLAAFVLSRNWRAWSNRWLTLGLTAIAVQEALLLGSGMMGTGWQASLLLRLSLGVAAVIPVTWLAFSLTFGESNGRSRLKLWRPVLLGLTAVAPLVWFTLASGRVIHPAKLEAEGFTVFVLDPWGRAYFSGYLLALALVLALLENLYRSAARLTRWKIKFLILGSFMAFACQIVAASYALLYGILHPLHAFYSGLGYLLGTGMIAFSLVRHRLLDVDIFVSRYVIYRSLTLALVGGYLLSLGLVAEVFRWLDITFELLSGTILALMGGGALAVLLLSEELRRKAKAFLHAHFYKHKYDYRQEWMEFTRRLSRAVAVPEIANQTVNRILEVMWVRQACMYILGDDPGHMALACRVGYAGVPSILKLPPPLREALRQQAESIPPVAAGDNTPDPTPVSVHELFGDTPVGYVAPVAALGSLVGLLVVGPELSGKPFGADDQDLIMAVATQAGAQILNARLSQQASEGREMLVIARLSAFVAHDLKNAVSMLSMVIENAKHHMANPVFQADAIRTLGDVTSRMRKLLTGLSSPGRHTSSPARPIGLAPSVEAWIQEIHPQVPSRIRIETRLGWSSDVIVDPEQFRSVLHNLILNSIEAIPGEGMIEVETSQENGYAVLVVTDTGSGIAQEFLRQKLFHPFQSTKPRGLGIGLYHCQQIIQGLGGTLTAESQEGKGTRMIVRLPTEAISAQHSAISLVR